MRLSRNRGNARGPTRLTNPLHRATSCRTHAVYSLTLATKPSLAVYSSFPFSRQRERERERERERVLLLSSNFPPFHPHSPPSLRSSCLLPAHFLSRLFPTFFPFILHSPCVSSVCSMHSFHFLSLFHNPPTTVFIFRYSFFPVSSSSSVILPMFTSLCSSISSPCSNRIPSLPVREVHPPVYPPLISSSANTIGHLHQLHTRGWNVPCHLCYRITPGLFRSLNGTRAIFLTRSFVECNKDAIKSLST